MFVRGSRDSWRHMLTNMHEIIHAGVQINRFEYDHMMAPHPSPQTKPRKVEKVSCTGLIHKLCPKA